MRFCVSVYVRLFVVRCMVMCEVGGSICMGLSIYVCVCMGGCVYIGMYACVCGGCCCL